MGSIQHFGVILVVVAALLHTVDAYSVEASVRNLCSEPVYVSFSNGDAYNGKKKFKFRCRPFFHNI
jgi:hypothetical protein